MVATETKTDTPTATATATATAIRSSLSLAASSSGNDSDKEKGMSIGFIGCGTIAASIVKGLVLAATEATATAETEDNHNMNINSMIVSKRSISKSNDLREIMYWYNYRQNYNDNDHPTFIEFSTTENNQEILNQADVIFVTVRPDQAKDVLQQLQFDSNRHILISLVVCIILYSIVYELYCIVFYYIGNYHLFRFRNISIFYSSSHFSLLCPSFSFISFSLSFDDDPIMI